MTRFVPTLRSRLGASVHALRKDVRAIAFIETALTMPVLIFTGLAGLEIANLMITHTRISGIALAVADNGSRMAPATGLLALPQVRESDVNDVFTGAQLQSGNLDVRTNGRIILSSLQVAPSGNNKQHIAWRRCFGNKNYSSEHAVDPNGVGPNIGGVGPTGSKVQATPGVPVMYVEIFYDYRPFMFASFIGNKTIRYTAAFTTRDSRDSSGVFNPNNATVANCN